MATGKSNGNARGLRRRLENLSNELFMNIVSSTITLRKLLSVHLNRMLNVYGSSKRVKVVYGAN